MQLKQSKPTTAEAEVLALGALRFLAGEPERLGRFLALAGIGPTDLMARAADPALLGAVLDHVLGDESLLHLCAHEMGVSPETMAIARQRLPGAAISA